MKLLKNKIIYNVLYKLDNIWTTNKYLKLIKDIEYQWVWYSSEEEVFNNIENIYMKCNKKGILENYISKNTTYFSELSNYWYIKIIKSSYQYSISFPILENKWKIFLENYENRNIIDKFEELTKYYPNSVKLLLWFILWIIATIITTYIKILIT